MDEPLQAFADKVQAPVKKGKRKGRNQQGANNN